MTEQALQIEDGEKIEILRETITQHNAELLFWRERNWTALRDTVAAFIVLAGLSLFENSSPLVLAALIFAIAVVASVYQKKNFDRYQQRLELRVRVEAALGFFTTGAYITGQPLYPDDFKSPKADWRGSYAFVAATWVVAISGIVALLIA